MPSTQKLVGLDVGEKRIGVSVGFSDTKIAVPYCVIDVDGSEITQIMDIIKKEDANIVVIGYPRNQSGEPTRQTRFVEEFANKIDSSIVKVVFQDESMTSVLSEERLSGHKKPFKKGDIDAMAASIILQDFIEANYGRQ